MGLPKFISKFRIRVPGPALSYHATNPSSQQTFVGLQDVFSGTIFLLPRLFRDVLNTSLKTSSRRLWRQIFILKTSSRHVLKTSSRHASKTSWRATKYLLGRNIYLYLTKLNLHLANLYLTNLVQMQGKSEMH